MKTLDLTLLLHHLP